MGWLQDELIQYLIRCIKLLMEGFQLGCGLHFSASQCGEVIYCPGCRLLLIHELIDRILSYFLVKVDSCRG
jgi:hypothetical protein